MKMIPENEKSEFFNNDVATLGDRLEAARHAKGYSKSVLAEKIGVSSKTVRKWESDMNAPRANHLQTLAGILGVSIIWLIEGQSNGTHNVINAYQRPEAVNHALNEIKTLKSNLESTLEKLGNLETQLEKV